MRSFAAPSGLSPDVVIIEPRAGNAKIEQHDQQVAGWLRHSHQGRSPRKPPTCITLHSTGRGLANGESHGHQ